ncbi:MAG: hypothetical protein KC506_02265 [Nanoarchaeota archaeon]|nr:hypothetical protein [Nanoarchaeota archaeon]
MAFGRKILLGGLAGLLITLPGLTANFLKNYNSQSNYLAYSEKEVSTHYAQSVAINQILEDRSLPQRMMDYGTTQASIDYYKESLERNTSN